MSYLERLFLISGAIFVWTIVMAIGVIVLVVSVVFSSFVGLFILIDKIK